MKSPNQIIIDQIQNKDILEFHKAIDELRVKYALRVRIKENGRTSSPLFELPRLEECNYGG